MSNISLSDCKTSASTVVREKKINEFFERDDVSRIRPDKKLITTEEGTIQIQYLIGDLKILHMKYCAEMKECYYTRL